MFSESHWIVVDHGGRVEFPLLFIMRSNRNIQFVGNWDRIQDILDAESIPDDLLKQAPEVNTFYRYFRNMLWSLSSSYLFLWDIWHFLLFYVCGIYYFLLVHSFILVEIRFNASYTPQQTLNYNSKLPNPDKLPISSECDWRWLFNSASLSNIYIRLYQYHSPYHILPLYTWTASHHDGNVEYGYSTHYDEKMTFHNLHKGSHMLSHSIHHSCSNY